MSESILSRIDDLGKDPKVTLEQLDEFVDECLAFLKREQASTPGLNLSRDMFDIESARQEALINKYSRTVQKP